MENKPLLNWKVILLGFLAGSLLSAPFALNTGSFIEWPIFVFGLFVALYVIIPSKEEEYMPIISILSMVMGFIISIVLSSKYSLYLPLVAGVAVAVIILKLLLKFQRS